MVHGVYHFGRKRVACRNAYCTTCRATQFAEGRRSIIVLHVAFIPVLPLGAVTRWYCGRCQQEVDAHRPTRRWILVAGVLLGLLASVAGISILRDADGREAAIGCFILGAALIFGCGYLLRKSDYQEYVAGRNSVTPLAGDHCPYCAQPVFASERPRCHTCRVNIVTR